MHIRRTTTAVVTGKPLNLGGSRGRREATGRGVMIACREALKLVGLRPEDTRVVVQGSGNVGGVGALLLHREGYKVVAISDMYGTIHNEQGLDMPAVMAWLKEHRRLDGYAEAEHLSNKEQIELDCDLLIPAATENQITSQNVDRVKARLIVEGANGPTTAAADRILDDRGVVVVPDILANAGGVTVSYFEWVQALNRDHWDEAMVNEKLRGIMIKAFAEVLGMALREGASMRTGAYLLAVQRVADAMAVRGLYP
jgi:glutamate dehydrogenase (NAD(P)+)